MLKLISADENLGSYPITKFSAQGKGRFGFKSDLLSAIAKL